MTHLTDDQIDDLLIGNAALETTAHLAACSACTARLTAMQQPIAGFNAAATAWGERRSATLPLQLPSAPAGLFHNLHLRITLGAATAAVLVLALAIPLLHHGSATELAHRAALRKASAEVIPSAAALPPVATSVVTDQHPQAPDPQQIARDNQLLQAIDLELAASETPADLVKMAGQQYGNQSSPDVTHNE